MRTPESAHDRRRLRQWLAGEARADGVSRRDMLRLLATAGGALAVPTALNTRAAAATSPGIVKPLPDDWFTVRGTNAETRFDSLADTGHHTPVERFFVRNHTSTPVIDAADWTLTVHGDGLAHGRSVDFTLDDLKRLPAVTRSAFASARATGAASSPLSRDRPSPAPPGRWGRSARPGGGARGSPTCSGTRGSAPPPWT